MPIWERRASTEEARVGMLRCRKEGLVCGFISRERGRAWAVKCVETSAAMAGRFADRPGRATGLEERRERVSRIINSVSSAGSGTSAADVDCRAADDAFVDCGAGEVRGSSERAVWRMRARVAFRRRALRSWECVSRSLWFSYWRGGRTSATASRSAFAGCILVPPSGERRVVERVLWRSANLGFAARTALSIGGIIVVFLCGWVDGWQPCLGDGVVYSGSEAGRRGEGDAVVVGAPQRVDPLGQS